MKNCRAVGCLWMVVLVFVFAATAADAPKLTFKFTTIQLKGAQDTRVFGTNNLGVMVGAYVDSGGVSHGFMLKGAKVTTLDDSKGTNVGATIAAVAGMPGPLVMIAGGLAKGQDFTPLASAFRGKVRHAVLIGTDAPALAAALKGVCTVETAASMQEAVEAAARAGQPGDTVLLSPACASFDMFKDYGHRGDKFAAAVRGLAARPA